jgi:hypothetical protein
MPAKLKIGTVLLALLALAGCGSETTTVVVEPRCAGPDLGLDGLWFGAMEDDSGTLFTLEWEVCGDRIAREVISGLGSSVTGRLWQTGPGAWRGVLSDGTELWMLTSRSRRHLMMVNDFFEFAVLEREALDLPGWLFSDLDGHWSGRHARTGWSAFAVQPAWALCGARRCDTTEAGGISATLWFDVLNGGFGMYRGEYADSWGDEGIAGALMSPDLLFLGTYTCPFDYLGPEDCTFGALNFD